MANNYCNFSEYIEDLTPAACEWVETVLGLSAEDAADNVEKLADMLEQEPTDEFAQGIKYWPHFAWEIDGKLKDGALDKDPTCKHDLWLYTKESCNLEHVAWFIQALISKFMPDYVFTLTSAETCDRPKIKEFGGSWLVINKDEALWGNTWTEAEKLEAALKTGNIGPEIDDEETSEAEKLRKLIEAVEARNWEPHDLDDHVHELKSNEASTINNTGIEAQVEYLMEQAGEDWVREIFVDSVKLTNEDEEE
jgi:hypothetical protein